MDTILKSKYENTCNEYIQSLCDLWHCEKSYGWWVNDEVGGVWCYGDCISLNMSDIVYIVNNNIQESVVVEWLDYSVFAIENNFVVPNLKSWVNGCPRLPKQEMQYYKNAKTKINK